MHTSGGYRLTIAPEDIDAYRFQELVEKARLHPESSGRAQAVAEALDLWQGEPYSDVADGIWLAPTISGLRESRSLSGAIGYSAGLAVSALHESILARYLGDIDRSRRLLDRWLTVGDLPTSDVMVQFEVGFLSLREGDASQAQSALANLSPVIAEANHPIPVARMLELAAGVYALCQRGEEAARTLGVAYYLRSCHDNRPNALEKTDLDCIWKLIGALIDEDTANACFEAGQQKDYRDFVAALVDETR